MFRVLGLFCITQIASSLCILKEDQNQNGSQIEIENNKNSSNQSHRSLRPVKRQPHQTQKATIRPEMGVIDQCVAIYGDLPGTIVSQYKISGLTTKEKDTKCCQLCADNPICDFWVRSTEMNEQDCWLKNAFKGYPLPLVDNQFNTVVKTKQKQLACCIPKPNFDCPPHKQCSSASAAPRGNFMGQAYAGVIFINIPWNGGAVIQRVLEHYANRYGLRTLRSVECADESNNILTQSASCCQAMLLDTDEFPPMVFPPNTPSSNQMLYQSFPYDPAPLKMYMSPLSFQRKIVFFRHPMDVLEAIFFTAALQVSILLSISHMIVHILLSLS